MFQLDLSSPPAGGDGGESSIVKLKIAIQKSGRLHEDSLRLLKECGIEISNGVNKLKNIDNAVLVVTHYQRLLDYIIPDFVHVLYNGRIVKTGTKELALELEEKGYDFIKNEVAEEVNQ